MKESDLNKNELELYSFMPTDFSDVGQGTLLARVYHNCLRYCREIGWLVYKNGIWTASDVEAQGYSQELTDLQYKEAEKIWRNNLSLRYASSAADKSYLDYASSRRSSARIAAALKEAIPKLHVDIANLDNMPLILNTPEGEIHLDTGEVETHDPNHLLTRMARYSPSSQGADRWKEFLLQISCGDETVAEFLQQFAGMAAIGKVYEERLVIAIGSGGNGKSTFFNAIQDVLGDYAGTIRSELLIASNDSGKKFEYARLRGKRFLIAEELEEGKQLDTAALKHLCSTGDINAQFKGKDIFTFKPSHSAVLCTNHMPAVKSNDSGTWDRLIVIPFEGRFRHKESEIKNYGAYLVEHCGGAILKWIIEGSKKYIKNDYKLVIPKKIQEATENYQIENDWSADFFEEYLIFNPELVSTGSELYEAYKSYSYNTGTTALPQNIVLPRIALHTDVVKKRTNKGTRYTGVGIRKSVDSWETV